MLIPSLVHVDDATRVAETRRLAVTAARAEGMTEHACEEVAIIATEIATNLLKHARSGEMHITGLSGIGHPGVEILSIDRGPGVGNLAACMADGFSSKGTAGNGLGAISRLSDGFDGYSQPGRGTVLVARKFHDPSHQKTPAWVFGAVSAPYPGETACGDQWAVRTTSRGAWVMLADGLGHGILAADAANRAKSAFCAAELASVTAVLEEIHLSLRHTRGAAVAVNLIENTRVRHAGLGNITAVILGDPRPQFMVSHNGTAGLERRRIQQFDYALPPNATIVLHSDGLATSWSSESYPGLLRRHPSVIAGTLYRDATRGRDDVCVLVGRFL